MIILRLIFLRECPFYFFQLLPVILTFAHFQTINLQINIAYVTGILTKDL